MYLLSDIKPRRKTKIEKTTIGRVRMNSSLETENSITNAIISRTENIYVFLTLVFNNLDRKLSNGNKNDINKRIKTKLNKILNLLVKIKSII
ncbi:MAG TPA: hypothetical protein PLX95_00145 [bacterium]|nr:hypothetical protein [bacterium]